MGFCFFRNKTKWCEIIWKSREWNVSSSL